MKRIANAFSTIAFVGFCLVLSAGYGHAAIIEDPGKDVVQYPTNSCHYRGVVVGKFVWTGYETDHQIVCDFGSLGVWLWDSNVWTQISGANPDRMIGAMGFLSVGSIMSIIGDFGSMGLWKWDWSGWSQLSGMNATYVVALDDNYDGYNDIHAAFTGYGLWRMDGASGVWTALSTSLPLAGIASDFWTAWWDEGVHNFGSQGVWAIFIGNQGMVTPVISLQLSSATAWDDHAAADFGDGGGSGLIMDFGPLGIWLAEDYSAYPLGWHILSSYDPLRVREVAFAEGGNYDYELLCDFKSGALPGLWLWNYTGFPGTWEKISNSETGPGFCEPYNADGGSIGGDADEEVAVDFEGLGLWLYNNTDGSWVQMSAYNPVFMVRMDLHGSGVHNCLVVDFGAGVGLWCHDGTAKSWFKLSSHSPDEVFETD